MTIKEHIEAGHYPTDDKGRALVPMRCDFTATIYATDFPNDRPIIGRIDYGASQEIGHWLPDGMVMRDGTECQRDLLPPPLRKMRVTHWAIVVNGTAIVVGTHDAAPTPRKGEAVVQLTGECEVSW